MLAVSIVHVRQVRCNGIFQWYSFTMKLEDILKDTTTLENGCMVWNKSRTKGGYGQKGMNGTKYYTHRLVCEIVHGAPESKQEVLHSCDNPPCCNPNHLAWGTRKQNVADMLAKGRNRSNGPSGENHGMSKLTRMDVVEIRILSKNGFVLTDLAKMYGVSAAQIHLIVTRKEWKEVPEIGDFFTS